MEDEAAEETAVEATLAVAIPPVAVVLPEEVAFHEGIVVADPPEVTAAGPFVGTVVDHTKAIAEDPSEVVVVVHSKVIAAVRLEAAVPVVAVEASRCPCTPDLPATPSSCTFPLSAPLLTSGYTDQVFRSENDVPRPDQTVQVLEDTRIKSTRGQVIDGFPGRPGHGTKGMQIVLRTNYLHMKTAFESGTQEVPLYRYAVGTVGGEKLSKAKQRLLVQNILKDAMFANMQVATDYSSIVVTTKKVDLGPANRKQAKVELVDPTLPAFQGQGPENTQAQEAKNRRTKQYEIQSTGEFSLADLVRSIQATQPGSWFGSREDVVQLLNIVVGKTPNEMNDVYAMGQKKFFPDGHPTLMESQDIGGGLRAIRGYYSSVRTSSNRILVNLNVASAAFYKSTTLMGLIAEFSGGYGNETQVPNQRALSKAEAFIRMLRVRTNHLKALDASGKPKNDAQGKPQTIPSFKTVLAFAARPKFGNAKQVKFSWTDPTKPQAAAQNITVFEYFQKQHGITLKYPDWPVLNVGAKNDPSYLPVELATVLPGQPVRRLLSGDQTSSMINFAARAPRLNAESIAGTPGNGLKIMGFNGPAQTNMVNNFGFEVGTELITVPGRILPTPEVFYGTKKLQAREGSWNLKDVKFSKPGKFGNWACVVLNYDANRGNALLPVGQAIQGMPVMDEGGLLRALEGHLKQYGVQMGQRLDTQQITIPRPDEQSRPDVDRKLDETFLKAATHGIELLLIVLKEADKWLYSRIKYHGDVKHGVQSINAVGSKFQKPKGQDMYMGNLALKFNIKGGGVSHTQRDMYPLDGKNTCMLVGIDVTHPSPGSAEGSPSIAGVVASVDEHLCQWPGSLRSQRGREEMVQGLTEMMVERLSLWRSRNNNLPSKIIIYRDGVSEGQYNLVLQSELPPIHEAFKQLYGDAKKWPKVTIIVVGKRHHTRFYPTDSRSMDQRSGNPMPGTVVDRGITVST